MLQLNPQEKFILARQLEDSTDANTYYVRAVIKDVDGNTIETVDLTDNSSQFFSKTWTVPKDATGNGQWITIQTDVYTDAGYTTKSTLYGTRLDTYLIQQRVNSNLALGGGGTDVSYKKIRDILQEEINKIEIPKQKETDLSPVIRAIKSVSFKELETDILSAIGNIRIPEQKEVLFDAVMKAILATEKRIIGELTENRDEIVADLEKFILSKIGNSTEALSKEHTAILEAFEEVKKAVSTGTYSKKMAEMKKNFLKDIESMSEEVNLPETKPLSKKVSFKNLLGYE